MRKMSRGAYEDTKGFVRALETGFEVAVMTVLYYIIWRNCYPEGLFPEYYYKGKYLLMAVYAVLLLVFFQNSDCTKFGQLHRTDLAIGQMIALFLTNFITYFQLCLIANQMVSPLPILSLFAWEIAAAAVLIYSYTAFYYKLYAPHNMLLIYGSKTGVGLKVKMDSRQDKYRIGKIISIDAGYEKLCEEIRNYESVILNDVPAPIRNDILKFCYLHRVRTYVAPKLTDILIRGGEQNTLFDTPLILIRGTGLTPMERIIKRTMDIVLSLLAMTVALPIMAVIAVAIKLEDGGPVFYTQDRLTRNGREFQILKFRSMVVGAEEYTGVKLASGEDPRITKVGKVIRSCRLDELPQLFNILKGDMSIVGPRPERKCLADEYAKEIPEFSYRLKVRGGLTGYAQVYGKYNTSPYDKLRLDLMYIENYSLLLDIKLIILTLRVIFSKESTEGIDKAEEAKQRTKALLEELDGGEEQEDEEALAPAGK